jgi:hypothetical protein
MENTSKAIGKEKPSINIVHRQFASQLGKKQTAYFKAYQRTSELLQSSIQAMERARTALENFYETEEGQNLNALQSSRVNENIINRFQSDIDSSQNIQRIVLQRFKNK